MGDLLFKKVDYTAGKLLEDIALGEIGLPDIQRPFVWDTARVCDLFDSMYRGYPIGTLLFWENGYTGDYRTIGVNAKQKIPRLLIVDGQQRLTALYAVMKGVPRWPRCSRGTTGRSPYPTLVSVAELAEGGIPFLAFAYDVERRVFRDESERKKTSSESR